MAYEDILAAVDAVRLMDSVRAICTGERLSNEAEVRSFDVLEKLFTDAGCRVTREALPGYVSTPEGAAFEAGGIAYEVLTHPMTPSADGLEADLVYVPVDRTGSASAEEVSGPPLRGGRHAARKAFDPRRKPLDGNSRHHGRDPRRGRGLRNGDGTRRQLGARRP